MKNYHVYVLYSSKLDRYYIGYTSDVISERIRRHNSAHKGYTGKANDWQLKYVETYEDKSAALKRERELKSWKSKKKLEQLIGSGSDPPD